MKDIINETLQILKVNIPSIISLIGILISYFSIKKSYKNDLNKMKTEIITEKIEDLPFEILNIMHNTIKNPTSKRNVEDLSKFMYKVISYGSVDAVKIACCVQQTAYKNDNSYKLLAGFSLLITQLKYDLTGQVISPESYFQIKLNDYEDKRDEIVKNINLIIEDLNLKKEFNVK